MNEIETVTESAAGDSLRDFVLVRLTVRCWGKTSRSTGTRFAADALQADPGMVRESKRLIDPKALSEITTVESRGRAFLDANSLPHTLEGVRFVPRSMLAQVLAELRKQQEAFDAAVEAFLQAYPNHRDAALESLGGAADSDDYPEVAKLRKFFSFRVAIFCVGAADESAILDPAEVAKLNADFKAAMIEARESAVAGIRKEFAKLVDAAVERLAGDLDGKPKTFRNSLVENIRGFVEQFEMLNTAYNDETLAALVGRVNALLDGVDAQDLRDDKALRVHVARQLETVQERLDELCVDRPMRKLKIVRRDDVAA